jgi:hypothetical protein
MLRELIERVFDERAPRQQHYLWHTELGGSFAPNPRTGGSSWAMPSVSGCDGCPTKLDTQCPNKRCRVRPHFLPGPASTLVERHTAANAETESRAISLRWTSTRPSFIIYPFVVMRLNPKQAQRLYPRRKARRDISGISGIVTSGRRSLIKGYFRLCASRRCGHVFDRPDRPLDNLRREAVAGVANFAHRGEEAPEVKPNAGRESRLDARANPSATRRFQPSSHRRSNPLVIIHDRN